jgi:hypothetical protein
MPARPGPEDDEPVGSRLDPDNQYPNSSFSPQNNYTNIQNTSQQKNISQAEVEKLIAEANIKKQDEHWVRSYWRPAMGWLYMIICAFDFIIFPLITMFLPVVSKLFGFNAPSTVWASLTLNNGGLIHMAFGAILGVAAWSRGQEKISKIDAYK